MSPSDDQFSLVPDRPEYHVGGEQYSDVLKSARAAEEAIFQLTRGEASDFTYLEFYRLISQLERIVRSFFSNPSKATIGGGSLAADIMLCVAEDKTRAAAYRETTINRLVRAMLLTFSDEAYAKRREVVLRITEILVSESDKNVLSEACEFLEIYYKFLQDWQSDGALPDDILDKDLHRTVEGRLRSASKECVSRA